MTFSPTKEQLAAVEAFAGCDPLKINAFAGTGKTATLRLMANATERKGLYIAFNKAIATEAKRSFSRNVNAVTSHSLAFRSVIAKGYSQAQMLGKLNAKAVSQVLQLPALNYAGQRSLSPTSYGYLVAETIRSYAYSDLIDITTELIPLPGNLSLLSPKNKKTIRETVVSKTRDMWAHMQDSQDERFPLGHDGYFKVWSLSKPALNADFILLDEAQDSNPALLSVLLQQPNQVVFVGDRFQQIYEWRGAVNAMEIIATQNTLILSQSFRFGKAIAELATKIIQLIDPSAVVHGSANIDSKIGCSNPDAILSRTNASLVAYIMGALEAGETPYVVGGISELKWMLEDVGVLKSGRPATHPEFFGFNNWHEVLEFVQQPEGEHLATFVKIVEQYREDRIIAALMRTASDETDADLTLSTAHKAKGLEWSGVMLADDFPQPIEVTQQNEKRLNERKSAFFKGPDDKTYALSPEEIRLLYVASTRGKLRVHVPGWCTWFFGVQQSATPIQIDPAPGRHQNRNKDSIRSEQQPRKSGASRNTPSHGLIQTASVNANPIGKLMLIAVGAAALLFWLLQ